MKNSLAVFWGLGIASHWSHELSKYIDDYRIHNFDISDIPAIHSKEANETKTNFYSCDTIFLHSLGSYLLVNISLVPFQKIIAYDPNTLSVDDSITKKISQYFINENLKAVKVMLQNLSLRCNGKAKLGEYLGLQKTEIIGEICCKMQTQKTLDIVIKQLKDKRVCTTKTQDFLVKKDVPFEHAPSGFHHTSMLDDMKSFSKFMLAELNDR